MNGFIFLLSYLFMAVIGYMVGYVYSIERFNFFRFLLRRAVFIDSRGDYVGECRIDPNKKTFSFKTKAYLYLPDKSTIFKKRYMFWSTWYFFYNVDSVAPLVFNDKEQKVLPPAVLDDILESNHVRKLRESLGSDLSRFFTFRTLLIVVAVGLAVYLIFSGHNPLVAKPVVQAAASNQSVVSSVNLTYVPKAGVPYFNATPR